MAVHLHPVRFRKQTHVSNLCRITCGIQGDIESVAQMTPRQLTELFEKVSGSGLLRKDYEERQVPLSSCSHLKSVLHRLAAVQSRWRMLTVYITRNKGAA